MLIEENNREMVKKNVSEEMDVFRKASPSLIVENMQGGECQLTKQDDGGYLVNCNDPFDFKSLHFEILDLNK